MKLSTWFAGQLVQHGELQTAWNDAQDAERLIMADTHFYGVISGLLITEDSPASRTIFVSNGLAYAANGARAKIPSGTTEVDTTQDFNNDPTELVNPGWFKWLSVFIRQKRKFSDPRLDANNVTIFYVDEEDYEVILVQGPEASSNPTPPALRTDSVLLVDILVTQGQTQIDSGDFTFSRREDTVRISKPNLAIVEGTLKDGLDSISGFVSDIIMGAITLASQFITYSPVGGTNWADGTSVTGANVRDALDETRTDLASTGIGVSGAGKIGNGTMVVGTVTHVAASIRTHLLAMMESTGINNAVTTATFADSVTLPASSVWAAINTFVGRMGASASAGDSGATRIGSFALGNFTTGSVRDWFQQIANTTTANDGAKRVGAEAVVGSPTSLTLGTVRSQLSELLTAMNLRALKAGDTFTGIVNLNAGATVPVAQLLDVDGTAEITTLNVNGQAGFTDDVSILGDTLAIGSSTATTMQGPLTRSGASATTKERTATAVVGNKITISADVWRLPTPLATTAFTLNSTTDPDPQLGQSVWVWRGSTGAFNITLDEEDTTVRVTLPSNTACGVRMTFYGTNDWRPTAAFGAITVNNSA